MNERPILFTPDNAQKIHDGTKTMTRRIVKPQPISISWFEHQKGWCARVREDMGSAQKPAYVMVRCQYGQAGDRLYVKEPHYLYGYWSPNGVTKTGREKWRFVCERKRGVKFPDAPPKRVMKCKLAIGWYRRHARFMPRWAARTVVEIVSLRVERLQEITEEDARAEGCAGPEPRASFWSLWVSIYGLVSWLNNPWVWVIEWKSGASLRSTRRP